MRSEIQITSNKRQQMARELALQWVKLHYPEIWLKCRELAREKFPYVKSKKSSGGWKHQYQLPVEMQKKLK